MKHLFLSAALSVFAATSCIASVAISERPMPRPFGAVAPAMGPISTDRPAPRPKFEIHLAMSKPQPPKSGKYGRICGSREIMGRSIGRIKPALNGCGVDDAVEIVSVGGVSLSMPSRMDCDAANALNTWVKNGASPAIGRTGGGLKSLRVAAHYSCRTRNNQPGGKISEHGKGRAIDISGFTLNDGTSFTLLNGWSHKTYGPMLRKMHSAACGPFGTVLGPNSDRFHQDHFHFDTASYRSGSYCR